MRVSARWVTARRERARTFRESHRDAARALDELRK
jgi:hypothetical protein